MLVVVVAVRASDITCLSCPNKTCLTWKLIAYTIGLHLILQLLVCNVTSYTVGGVGVSDFTINLR